MNSYDIFPFYHILRLFPPKSSTGPCHRSPQSTRTGEAPQKHPAVEGRAMAGRSGTDEGR